MPTKTSITPPQKRGQPKHTKYANIVLRCFVAREFLSHLHTHCCVFFIGLKVCFRTNMRMFWSQEVIGSQMRNSDAENVTNPLNVRRT